MSLTSLPNELLFEIATLLFFDESELECSDCYSPSRRDCHAFAATCRITRRAAVNVLYKDLIIDPNEAWTCSLYKIFNSDPVVASCVRHLTLAFPTHRNFPGWSNLAYLLHCYRQIIKACTEVRSLFITTNYHSLHMHRTSQCVIPQKTRSNLLSASLRSNAGYSAQFWREFGNMTTILIYINPHSQKKIDLIEFKRLSTRELWLQFERLINFTSLKTLLITDCHIDKKATKPCYNNPDRYKIVDLPNRKIPSLPSVQILFIGMRAEIPHQHDGAALCQERTIGYIIASSMPNITALDISANYDIIYGALTRYADIGENLTQLTICTQFSIPSDAHLCDILSVLSPRLTHITINEGTEPVYFCHKLFAGKWTHLQQFTLKDCSFPYGCDGNDLHQLRTNLLHFLHSNPAAGVAIYSWRHVFEYTHIVVTKLVWKNPGEKKYFILKQFFSELLGDTSAEFMPDAFFPSVVEESESDNDQGGVEVVETEIAAAESEDIEVSDVVEWSPTTKVNAGGSDSESDLGGVDLLEDERYSREKTS